MNKLVNQIINNDNKLKLKKYVEIKKLDYQIDFDFNTWKNQSNNKKIYKINEKYFMKKYNVDEFKTIKCNHCKLPSGLYVFDRIYSNEFYKKVFNNLELTYTNNKNDETFSNYSDGNRIFMFDRLNIFETLEHSKKLNKSLYPFLSRIIIDIFSSLQVDNNNIKNLLINSKLVIARYTNCIWIIYYRRKHRLHRERKTTWDINRIIINPSKNISLISKIYFIIRTNLYKIRTTT